MVIIQNSSYIEAETAVIDNDEYVETIKNINRIKRDAERFLGDYCLDVTGIKKMNKKEFTRRYSFSPLKYFHKELNLPLTV